MECISNGKLVGLKFRRQDLYYLSDGYVLKGEEVKDFQRIPYEQLSESDKSQIDDIIFVIGRNMF